MMRSREAEAVLVDLANAGVGLAEYVDAPHQDARTRALMIVLARLDRITEGVRLLVKDNDPRVSHDDISHYVARLPPRYGKTHRRVER